MEEFKDIKGFEGLYMIGSCGNVFSLLSNKILKPCKNNRGYLKVGLYKERKIYKFTLHRLVAMAFIPNPNNLPQINHKDEDKTNNCIFNLEWCDNEYNMNYGTRNKRLSQIMKGNTNQIKRPVEQYTINGEYIKKYDSLKEAEKETNIDATHIGKCCRGMFKQMGGYKWKYA